jgi:diguanylate cyclase (GGDEF)-like protein
MTLMALLLKLFEMHSHRQVILRTIWSSFLLAIVTVIVATSLWVGIFPDSANPFIREIRIITFLLTLIIAVPTLYALFFMSLQVSRKNDELFQLANLDPLTGIYNRRALIERFAFLARKSRRTDEIGVLLVIDVDNFKSINDKYGHETGDCVLIHLATTLRALSGSNSCFARLGGEEFAAARFGVTEATALEFAEDIRIGIQDTPLKNEKEEISFTVSIGYCLVGENDTLNGVMRNADAALYIAKRTGRNRTVRFDANPASLAPNADDLIQVAAKSEASQLASSN